jgi:hypothetical protein
MKKIRRIIIGILFVIGVIALAIFVWKEYGIEKSNPNNYATIGDIPTLKGFDRIDGDDPKYTKFLRSLPLKPKGSIIKYYWGGIADLQELNYAVVDLPLLSNAEQCADVCMRLRAEYLYQIGNYSNISFLAANGNILSYVGEISKESLEKYLCNVFDVANTRSLSQQMDDRDLSDIQPGDVFVYPANNNRFGHAVMVADVAQDLKTGTKAIMLIEGFMPARSIHVMQNLQDPSHSPWFILDEKSDVHTFALFQFNTSDLRCFPPQ